MITRRGLISGLLVSGGLLGSGLLTGYMLRLGSRPGSAPTARPASSGMMGSATAADMSVYMELFNRHTEIRRTIEEISGGVRTTTESDSPELATHLQAHVSSMYSHVNQEAEVTCMSDSLPTLFHNSRRYRRRLTLTAKGVAVTETSYDPRVTAAIRAHAQEISSFVRDGMPAMMRGMMGG